MMKFVVCAMLAVAAFSAVDAGEKLTERAGFQTNIIKRLGHFNEQPFIDLYKSYAAAFVLPKHPERPKEDYRNYMPSGDECIIFFKKFRIDQYKLRSLDEFVVMDACLGYVFGESNKEIDLEISNNQVNQQVLEQLKADQKLYNIYDQTRVNQLGAKAQECVADLLLNSIVAKHQYPNVVCNNHYLQVFLQFAECQRDDISEQARYDDSYLQILYSLLKDSVGLCVDHEIGHIETAVRLAYKHNGVQRFRNKIRSKFSTMSKQAAERMWPHQVTTLLSAVQNTDNEVNQREVHQLIRGVSTNDAKLKQVLLNNLAEYANKKIKPAVNKNGDDPTGLIRYDNLIDSLCNYFRSSDQESQYDFATPMIRLVQLLAHEDLFGISQREFVTRILTRAKESAPIYLSVQACNILTYTEGALAMPTANTKPHYTVVFKQDTKGMVIWPDAGYF